MRDTIDMAREAGMDVDGNTSSWGAIITAEPAELERFATLVRADERSVEREACARVCEDIYMRGYGNCGDACDAIRERSSSHSDSANAGARGTNDF
jgi:hypothetical protein